MREEPSATAVAALTNFMFLPDKAIRADCTFVLGMTLFHRPVARAVELHDQNLAGRIIFSGGYNPRLQAQEADEMRALWCQLGRPEAVVQVERESTNTRENMEGIKSLLERQGLMTEIHSVNLVAISYHMRRALETFRDVFGDAWTVGTASYPSQYCSPHGWAQNARGRELVLSEFVKIRQHLPHRLPKMHC